jgi:hypothetical protein
MRFQQSTHDYAHRRRRSHRGCALARVLDPQLGRVHCRDYRSGKHVRTILSPPTNEGRLRPRRMLPRARIFGPVHRSRRIVMESRVNRRCGNSRAHRQKPLGV